MQVVYTTNNSPKLLRIGEDKFKVKSFTVTVELQSKFLLHAPLCPNDMKHVKTDYYSFLHPKGPRADY